MKRTAIFTIVACSIAVLLLSCVLVVGLTSDGFGFGMLWRNEDPAIENPAEYESFWDTQEDPVTGIDVEWVNGSVELKVGSGSTIRLVERGEKGLKEKDRLKLSSSGGKLKISWGENRFFLFNLFQNQRKDLVVEVPEDVARSLDSLACSNTSGPILASEFIAREMEFSSTSGNLELSFLEGEEGDFSNTSGNISITSSAFSTELSASTTSGTISLSQVKTGKAELSTVSGDTEYTGASEEINISSVSAQITAAMEECPNRADFDSVSGNIVLETPDNAGFEVDYSSISGTFSSDFPVSGDTGKSGRALYGAGKSKFSFSTTSGNMQIRKIP